MDITSLLGVIIGVLAVVGAMIFKHISFSVFINPAAFFVIFVGLVGCILNAFPKSEIKNIGKLFKVIFTDHGIGSNIELIKTMENLASIVRKEGLLVLESQIPNLNDEFLKKGLTLTVDGATAEYIDEVLSIEMESIQERHAINANIFAQAGAYAPTLGVLGAVFGLIAAMANINDINEMSHAIAAAFIATILGIFTGYVLWNPFANKLKVKSQHEMVGKKIIIEGVLSLQKGEAPAMIVEKLMAFLSPDEKKIMMEGRKDV